jgi:hypothetical protein
MRTTIRLPDDLLAEAKRAALENHRSLTALIEDALRAMLARRSQQVGRPPVKLTTYAGNGLQPGVDLNDSAGLLDRMDDGDGPAGR